MVTIGEAMQGDRMSPEGKYLLSGGLVRILGRPLGPKAEREYAGLYRDTRDRVTYTVTSESKALADGAERRWAKIPQFLSGDSQLFGMRRDPPKFVDFVVNLGLSQEEAKAVVDALIDEARRA